MPHYPYSVDRWFDPSRHFIERAVLLSYVGLRFIPESSWELSLGIYLIVKGFRDVPIRLGRSDTGRIGGVTVGYR